MGGSELQQRLAAIVFADAVDFSRLMTLDERATIRALEDARTIFSANVAMRGGRIVDMAGDSVLATFDTAIAAVGAALTIQEQLNAASAVPQPAMRFRIGIHLGDVIEKPDGTIYGDGVNIAARLHGLAAPGYRSRAVRTRHQYE